MDIIRYTGPQAFGTAYAAMLENDTHAPGSVDRDIIAGLVRICSDTVEYLYSEHTPIDTGYASGSRIYLEEFLQRVVRSSRDVEMQIEAVAKATKGLADNAPRGASNMRFGGTEEQIIERGSDWCTDVARVACVLYQICGLASRIINLFDVHTAYGGHVIVEVYRGGKWGAVDTSSGIIYKDRDGGPCTTWKLMNDSDLVGMHMISDAWYTTPNQFAAAGVSNYPVNQVAKYDYTVSTINSYYRLILEMASKGWPGGLRWLHGEDGS